MLRPRPDSLTIIIPSCIRADLLTNCLQSIDAHRTPGTEVLVVDDGSPHGEVSAAAQKFPYTRVLRSPKARGFCRAANAGVKHARTEFVELLNDDTEVEAGWAEAALASFEDPSIGAVAPLVLIHPVCAAHRRTPQ